jgi:hypothetical protein
VQGKKCAGVVTQLLQNRFVIFLRVSTLHWRYDNGTARLCA